MLKFVKKHMETINDVEVYPIISLLIFFVFFVILFWWVTTARQEYIENARNIPLEKN